MQQPPIIYPQPQKSHGWIIAIAIILGVPVVMLGALFIFILGVCGFFR